MGKTVIVAVCALVGGAAVGYILCGAAVRRLNLRVRRLRAQLQGEKAPGKMGVMDKVLIFEAAILIAYTIADLVVFWHTYAEPSTLTACVFGVCGLENGVMGWIKTNKDNTAGRDDPRAPKETPEPPDAG